MRYNGNVDFTAPRAKPSTVWLMGSFLDHLQTATTELRALQRRERLERAETRAEYARRIASRGPAAVARSSPSTRTEPPQPGS
jgi:hypothetical protein